MNVCCVLTRNARPLVRTQHNSANFDTLVEIYVYSRSLCSGIFWRKYEKPTSNFLYALICKWIFFFDFFFTVFKSMPDPLASRKFPECFLSIQVAPTYNGEMFIEIEFLNKCAYPGAHEMKMRSVSLINVLESSFNWKCIEIMWIHFFF